MLVKHLEVAHQSKVRLLFGQQLGASLAGLQPEDRAELVQAVVLVRAVGSVWEWQSCQLPAVQG